MQKYIDFLIKIDLVQKEDEILNEGKVEVEDVLRYISDDILFSHKKDEDDILE